MNTSNAYDLLIKIISVMSLIGIPSIFAIVVGFARFCVKQAKQIKILMKSQQAQMRTNLLEKYHIYMDRGWISEEELADWENQYQSYHELGANGVLNARREQLFELPSKER